jgi:hypothetical protein
MKKSIIFLLMITFIFSINLKAQTCEFFPLNEGSILVTKNYDKKDKLTSWNKQTILKKENLSNGVAVLISVEGYDTKTDTAISKSELKYECKDNVLYVDMNSFIAPGSLAAYQDMDMKINSDNISMPANMKTNDVLDNGNVDVKVSSNGVQILNMVIAISNRKVLAIENLTTPAGTFECYKISSDVETKMIFTANASVIEWYSKEVGMVRSETYDKNGKLSSYSVLETLTKK